MSFFYLKFFDHIPVDNLTLLSKDYVKNHKLYKIISHKYYNKCFIQLKTTFVKQTIESLKLLIKCLSVSYL